MIIIGLVLLVVAVIFGVDLIFTNSHHIASPAIFGQSLGFTNEATLFVVGVITGAVLLLGIVLLLSGMRHKGAKAIRRHHEDKAAKNTRSERDRLASDNEHLRGELAQQHSNQEAAPTSSGAATDEPADPPSATGASGGSRRA